MEGGGRKVVGQGATQKRVRTSGGSNISVCVWENKGLGGAKKGR